MSAGVSAALAVRSSQAGRNSGGSSATGSGANAGEGNELAAAAAAAATAAITMLVRCARSARRFECYANTVCMTKNGYEALSTQSACPALLACLQGSNGSSSGLVATRGDPAPRVALRTMVAPDDDEERRQRERVTLVGIHAHALTRHPPCPLVVLKGFVRAVH